ncbi:hypothetical protein KKJ17_13810 [Xenorhabdus bovienii]|nr:hypothetical protein [Xenorhabdus bovienii]MDE9518777.1 hypothetical protein [Xenorhabdus bovienii]MDE9540397.1 hypothetical protein [Xenorhabdus bovienii]CDH29383.1 conserved hypothetical protein [Xenorhabdus bovienii str. Jollieti]
MDTEPKRIESKERKLWEKFKLVTALSFSQFLRSRGIPAISCVMCGNKDVRFPSMADGTDEEFYLIPIEVNEVSIKSKYNIAKYKYRGICQNCSHEMYFNAYHVINWLENGGKQSTEGKNG